ncbi:hypothetical protein B0H19DRAFT_1072176 [Mycena capillaripes]|nr:hypothetical protein B0H19DRAFT_1072176 [Mycena capillaripes]
MHPCLKIPELVHLIFSNFATEYGRNGKALSKLGQTCRAFHDPAMDLLWKDPGGFRILQCMPSDLFTIKVTQVASGGFRRTAKLLRPIVARDWDRALFYILRVKIFQFRSCDITLCSEIFPALMRSHPMDCFFPNLIALRWTRWDADFPYINHFISSKITSIIVWEMPPSCITSLLSSLSANCCRLQMVDIRWSVQASVEFQDMEDRLHRSVSAFVRQLSVVQHLHILLPDVSSVEHVEQIESLRVLGLPTIPLHVLPRSTQSPASFLNLSQLFIERLTFETAIMLIRMCTESAFQTLHFTFQPWSKDELVHEFYTALAHCSRSHVSLQLLMLQNAVHHERHLVQDMSLLRKATLEPLFSFRNLTKIEIESPSGFDLNDGFCAEIARAWPNAERITLKPSYQPATPSATFESLRSFAEHCRHLIYLHITLDARVVPHSRLLGREVHHPSLDHLHVGYSLITISEVDRVAAFLSSIFYNLTLISHSHNIFTVPEGLAWDEVESALAARHRE